MDKDKKSFDLTPFETVMLWFLVSLIVIALLNGIFAMLLGQGNLLFAGSKFILWLKKFVYPLLIFLSFVISALSIAGLTWAVTKLTQINQMQNALYAPPVDQALVPTEDKKNTRWIKVGEHINSLNPNDWKLAILECDIILDELMSAMGYHGETLSDKLKGVEKSDFVTIDEAWEAHKVRNQIAHEGSDFLITEREARRIVGLYEKVFREFSFI